LKDDFGFPIPPANLTTGQFKSGASQGHFPHHVNRAFRHTDAVLQRLVAGGDRWALSYYVLSLSAFTIP